MMIVFITGVGLISSTILSRIVTPVMYKLIQPSLENDDEKAEGLKR
jgi:multidrug efflux pump subunit AcrB